MLCRYYFGVEVAIMAAEAAARCVKGEVYWREKEWRMVKYIRKRVLAAEEMTATEARHAARENRAASERAFTEFFHSQTKTWQRIHKRGVEFTERARVFSEAATRGLELAELRNETWAYRLERKLAKKRRRVWGERKSGGGVREENHSELSAIPPQHEQDEEHGLTQARLSARLLSLLAAAQEEGERKGGGDEGKKRERNRSRSRSESRENSDDAAFETKRRRQAREGQHCEVPPGSRHQVVHWGNVAGRRKGDPRDRGPEA